MLRSIIAVLGFVVLGSCAMFFGNTNREVHIDSEPHGAYVYVNGVFYAKTPAKILLANAGYSAHKIVVTKPGFESQDVVVTTKFQKVGYLNLLFPIGFLIDSASDTMFELNPLEINQFVYLKESHVVAIKQK